LKAATYTIEVETEVSDKLSPISCHMKLTHTGVSTKNMYTRGNEITKYIY